MSRPHILLVTFPARGHLNPTLCFARRLIQTTNARVTFVTCVSGNHDDLKPRDTLSFLTFSDGFDDGVISTAQDRQKRNANLKINGDKTLSEFIEANRNGDSPVTCLICTLFLTWVPEVARRFHIPSALLWIQPAFIFDIYHKHFIENNSDYEFPNLPSLKIRDLPSFLTPSNTNQVAYAVFKEQMEYLKDKSNLKILVNTFDSLEKHALKAIPNVEMVAVGPLLPPEVFGEISKSVGESCYTDWLDSKTESSVIYVSFGTMAELSKKQLQEVARALIDGKRPFLWTITGKTNRHTKTEGEDETEIEKIADFRHELDEFGMIVAWCSQVEVLRHGAVGCFLTHCGWNSTLESLVFGVPVVAFPIWSDQPTNAKFLEDSWKTGVRVRENEEGFVDKQEIRRCLEVVMEEKALQFRENAEKWKRLAAEAGGEGGSLDKNMKAFVETLF